MRCRDCIRGPEGLFGHDNIYVVEPGNERMSPIFGCMRCPCRYVRRHDGRTRHFIWTRLPESEQDAI